MTFGKGIAAAALLALAAGLSGCGEKCNTEPVAKVEEAMSCTATPGARVTLGVRLCPTCNQTGATCEVDTSQAESGIIQLDPIVEACEDVTSCASPAPACEVNALPCSFDAPTAPCAACARATWCSRSAPARFRTCPYCPVSTASPAR